MASYTVHAAKTHLSKLLAAVEAGEEVLITRRGKTVARLVAAGHPAPTRRFGALKGQLSVGPEFFEPLPDDELDAWDGVRA